MSVAAIMSGAAWTRNPKSESDEANAKTKTRKTTKIDHFHFGWDLYDELAKRVEAEPETVAKTCQLLDDSATIPFICRYRQDVTKGMGPEEVQNLQEEYEELKTVRKRAQTLFHSLNKNNQLTQEIMDALFVVKTLEDLEVITESQKAPKKKSAVSKAKNAGLGPLANMFLYPTPHSPKPRIDDFVRKGIEGARNYEQAFESTLVIVSETLSHSLDILNFIDDTLAQSSLTLQSRQSNRKKAKAKSYDSRSKFDQYFNFSLRVKNVKPHQVLAINRGEKEGVLKVSIPRPKDLETKVWKFFNDRHNLSSSAKVRFKMMNKAFERALSAKIWPMVVRKVRAKLNKLAENASIKTFCDNLRYMLMAPPVRNKTILGVDPGYKNGCKLAVIHQDSQVLDTGKIYLPLIRSDQDLLCNMVLTYKVDVVVIGNGTGSRDAVDAISKLLRGIDHSIQCHVVNEFGASYYSCSKLARVEHPYLDLTMLGAVSIARRYQDPLAELVKIDPQHLGVGMYQHDVSKVKLKKWLNSVVEECVSYVGVDINHAPQHILTKVAGIGEARAKKIVDYRTSNGFFTNLQELKKVKTIGESVFTQIAGFIRIFAHEFLSTDVCDEQVEPLDALMIHPEMYDQTQDILNSHGFTTKDLGQRPITSYFKEKLKNNGSLCSSDVRIIMEALAQPFGQDARGEYVDLHVPLDQAKLLCHLNTNDILEGKVVNVVEFGAFVDCGLEKDGLVHSLSMGTSTLHYGQRVRVKVITVDPNRKRFRLELLNII